MKKVEQFFSSCSNTSIHTWFTCKNENSTTWDLDIAACSCRYTGRTFHATTWILVDCKVDI